LSLATPPHPPRLIGPGARCRSWLHARRALVVLTIIASSRARGTRVLGYLGESRVKARSCRSRTSARHSTCSPSTRAVPDDVGGPGALVQRRPPSRRGADHTSRRKGPLDPWGNPTNTVAGGAYPVRDPLLRIRRP
jgi:hypothetical protein